MSPDTYIASGLRAVRVESQAVAQLEHRISDAFARACDLIMQCRGRVIVSGVGKSGHIARKIAATLSSTGTPAYFVHPGEASHGDFGMVTREDIVMAISNSGTTNELVNLIPMFKRLGNTIISLTGNQQSPLAEFAAVNLDISVQEEACPHNLAPTSSTTVTLVLGDAIAVALLEARGFSANDFALSHPGGAIGKKLLLRTGDVMHSGSSLPACRPDQRLSEVLTEMTAKGLGMTTITDEHNHLLGIFTDGDLRRCVHQQIDLNRALVGEVMTRKPRTIEVETLAAEALRMMEQHKITALVVNDDAGRTAGVVHMHDLLRAGIY